MSKKQLIILGVIVAVVLIATAAVWGLNRGMEAQQEPEPEPVVTMAPPKEARPPRPPKGGEGRPPRAFRPPQMNAGEGEGQDGEPKRPESPGDMLSAFINGTDGEPIEPINKDEALEAARKFLEEYRNMTPEDQMGARIGAGIFKGVLDNLSNEAANMVEQMPEERKMEILSTYEENAQVLLELEEELTEEMDDQEKRGFGPVIESLKNLNKGFYDAILESQK